MRRTSGNRGYPRRAHEGPDDPANVRRGAAAIREARLLSEQEGRDGSATECSPISVFLVDDVPEMRELIRLGMEQDPGFEVVGEASDGRTAVDGVAETRPAAVLLDLSMPDMNGLEAILEIRRVNKGVAIVVLSGFSVDRMGPPTLARGADGYVEKGTPIQELRDAIRLAVAKRRGD
jgi:DNA-binding response OmpR family regulator